MSEQNTDMDIKMLNKVLATLYLDLLPDDDPDGFRIRIREELGGFDRQFSIERPSARELYQAAQSVASSDAAFGGEIRSRIVEEVVSYCQLVFGDSPNELQTRIEKALGDCLDHDNVELPGERRTHLAQFIYGNLFGWDPITSLLTDSTVTEILVDGPDEIYFERFGRLEDWPESFLDSAQLMDRIRRIFAPLSVRIDALHPIQDARLPDGSRANVVLPPISLNGPALTIRKSSQTPLTIEDLVRFGSWSEEMVMFLHACIIGRLNILVTGGTGSGKTALVGILTGMIPSDERVITIEGKAELRPRNLSHLVRLESRPPNIEGKGEITMRDLVLQALHMRPDRIVMGENQGPEVPEIIQAMCSGHDGTFLCLHATSPRDALSRLETMITMAHPELPVLSAREQLAAAIDLIVYQERLNDGTRKVMSVSEVRGMESTRIVWQDIFTYQQTGMVDGRVVGYHTATGVVPKFLPLLQSLDIDLPLSTFTPRAKTAGD